MFAVLLRDPKYPHNVGGALRACHLFGGSLLFWSGHRVEHPDYEITGRGRLPREERLREYRSVALYRVDAASSQRPLDEVLSLCLDAVPVAVERRANAESLAEFEHPWDALYVFGPEDGTLGRPTLAACHRFVTIPTIPDGPLNLAAAVNVVLYDRFVKLGAAT